MQGAAAAMAASLRAGQPTDDVHPLYKRGKNASKSPQLMRSGMLPPNPEQDAGGDPFTRLVRRSIARVSSKPRSTSTAVSSQREGWRDEIAASFRRRTSCRPGQGRAPARRSRVDAGAGVQAAAGLPLYKQKRPSMIGKQLDMKTLVETNFILKRKERRRKEMEARRRAEMAATGVVEYDAAARGDGADPMGDLLEEIDELRRLAATYPECEAALAAASDLNVSFMPYVIAVMLASSTTLATPIGYPTNLIVYGPGGYRFSDYLRLGAPLSLIIWGLAVILIPRAWPF